MWCGVGYKIKFTYYVFCDTLADREVVRSSKRVLQQRQALPLKFTNADTQIVELSVTIFGVQSYWRCYDDKFHCHSVALVCQNGVYLVDRTPTVVHFDINSLLYLLNVYYIYWPCFTFIDRLLQSLTRCCMI